MSTRTAKGGATGATRGPRAEGSRGARLIALRAVCVGLALLAVAAFVAGLPLSYAEAASLPGLGPAARTELRANLDALGLTVGFYAAWFAVIVPTALAAVFFLVAAVIFWRRSDEPMALFFVLLLVLFGATRGEVNEALGDLSPSLGILTSLLEALSLASVFSFFFLFPDGRFVPRWARWVVPVLAGYTVLTSLLPGSTLDPKAWSGLPYTTFFGGWFVAGVAAQIYRYRRASGVTERQQTKWVVFGFAAMLVAYLGTILLFFVALDPPEPGSLADLVGGTVFYATALFAPVTIGVAVLRYRLWDIDVLINRTLVYGSLTAVLGLVYHLGVVLLQAPLRDVVDQESQFATTASTLAVVALFMPLRRRIQTFIDRRFYRTRYDARKILETFSTKLRDETDLGALNGELARVVTETVQPAYASLWLRQPEDHDRRPAPRRHESRNEGGTG